MADARTIGVDVGGTKIAAGVVDREGGIEGRLERPTPTESQQDLLAALDEMVEELRAEDVAAIGFGLPSTIDQRSGRAISSVHIPLADLDFRDRMRERFSLPVGIDNDANAATLAEWQIGAGRGTRYMVMLTLGTGVGGGLVLDGKLYRGAVGAAAELGHMVLVYGGEPCGGTCQGHGHFEQFASGRAADRAAREILGEPAGARELVTAAREGNDAALEAMQEIGRRLGAGIGTLVNVFDPELVVVGGGFSSALDLLLEPAREVVAQEALPPGRTSARIVPAELGSEAGLIGAGLVGFEALDG
ncbi:MAG TPA: ROK family protein [Gaiellaceae bacterium]|nr:ROK family protein [Gaiellaceae bacterium]